MNKEAQAESSKKTYEKKANSCTSVRLGHTLYTGMNLRLSKRETESHSEENFNVYKSNMIAFGIPSIRI